ncbi:MAG: DNA recombination protein RmuC [Armatimonadetes bacterium]|nr:DNA recombination protein RmuC [Armatimonadota bacterium]
MDFMALSIGLLIGGVVAGLLVALFLGKRAAAVEAERSRIDGELRKLQVEHASLQSKADEISKIERSLMESEAQIKARDEELVNIRILHKEVQTKLEERERALEEQRVLLDEAKDSLKETFENLSTEALRKSNSMFLELAKEQFNAHAQEADSQLVARQKAISQLVEPLQDKLKEVNDVVREIENKREGAYAKLDQQVQSLTDSQMRLQGETKNLVQALRTPNQRGQWGEVQLRKVVEMAGMIDHCDFVEQASVNTEEGRLRPDLVIKLPNNKNIVVDSKVPLQAYMNAIELDDDDAKKKFLMEHARQTRKHVTQLTAKSYWQSFNPAPDFVVMFIPSEPIYGAALEHDPTLLEFGATNSVLIVTPTSLIGLLRTVAMGWRQENLAKDAQKIADVGEELYRRIQKLAEHFSKVGKHLDNAVESYNDMVGTMETRVLPSARDLKKLQSSNALVEIGERKEIERRTRSVRAPELLTLAIEEPTLALDAATDSAPNE